MSAGASLLCFADGSADFACTFACTAGRFPAAFALSFDSVVSGVWPGDSLRALSFAVSDPPVADCELWRRGIAGLRLDAADATIVGPFFLGGPVVGVFFLDSLVEELVGTFSSPPEATVVLLDEVTSLSLLPTSSASEPSGDTNRAVGRGPEAEGPLGFFRMGFPGGFLVEEGAMILCSTLDC